MRHDRDLSVAVLVAPRRWQYPECVNNLVINMMDTYDNFDEIKTQIFALAENESKGLAHGLAA